MGKGVRQSITNDDMVMLVMVVVVGGIWKQPKKLTLYLNDP